MSKLTIKEIKQELNEEFSFISNFEMMKLFDYVHKTKFSSKLNEKRINEDERLEINLRMFVKQILEKANDSDIADLYMY